MLRHSCMVSRHTNVQRLDSRRLVGFWPPRAIALGILAGLLFGKRLLHDTSATRSVGSRMILSFGRSCTLKARAARYGPAAGVTRV